jgi:hypothetical protein
MKEEYYALPKAPDATEILQKLYQPPVDEQGRFISKNVSIECGDLMTSDQGLRTQLMQQYYSKQELLKSAMVTDSSGIQENF